MMPSSRAHRQDGSRGSLPFHLPRRRPHQEEIIAPAGLYGICLGYHYGTPEVNTHALYPARWRMMSHGMNGCLIILTSLVRENAIVECPWQHVHAAIFDGSVNERHPCSDHKGLVAVRHRIPCLEEHQTSTQVVSDSHTFHYNNCIIRYICTVCPHVSY